MTFHENHDIELYTYIYIYVCLELSPALYANILLLIAFHGESLFVHLLLLSVFVLSMHLLFESLLLEQAEKIWKERGPPSSGASYNGGKVGGESNAYPKHYNTSDSSWKVISWFSLEN